MPDLSSLTPAELEQFLNGPALTPPDGVIPNFDNRDNKNYIANIEVCGYVKY